MLPFPQIKIIEVLIAAGCVLAVLALIFGSGWYFRGIRAERDMLAYKTSQDQAVEKDRSQKQEKSDKIDEEAAAQIQELMVKNAQLQTQLEKESIKPDYDCVVPSAGVSIHNNAIRANKR